MALKDRLTSFATTVGGRANNAIENGKLGLKISGEERKINDYTLQIGELIVERLDNGETFDDEIAALFASIKASRDVIAAARADIEVNRQENEAMRQASAPEVPADPVCPACGASVSADANFCPQCGAKVEVDEAPAPAPAEEACPACSAPAGEACCAPEETPAEAPAEPVE